MRMLLFLITALILSLGAQPASPVPPGVRPFVPANAILVKHLDVDFENDGQREIVIAYASDVQMRPSLSTGVRVLKHEVAARTVTFEENDSVDNGGGPFDAIDIGKVKAATGEEAAVVILKFSGAGTATDWHVLASLGNKISRLDPTQERANLLKKLRYQDNGYNSVTTQGPFVIEPQPGYSRETARCCPDRPSIEMLFKFTGKTVIFDSFNRLPFKATKD
jgi:hypothetical protein